MFDGGLAELHTHLGGSVASDILWSLAHEQGIALPVKVYCPECALREFGPRFASQFARPS
jgi:adenosine deaminase